MKEHRSAVAHRKATDWAQSIAINPNAVMLDLETTGLGETAEICDVGIVSMPGAVLVDMLVKPQRGIPADASRVHGITNEMVADAPSWAEAWPIVEAAIAGKVICIYNASYDTGILKQCCRELGIEIDIHAECALKAFSEWEGAPGKFPGSYRWFKLDDAAAKFGIKPGGHRALADAETARLVVLAMAATATIAPPEPVPIRPQPSLFDLPDASRFTR